MPGNSNIMTPCAKRVVEIKDSLKKLNAYLAGLPGAKDKFGPQPLGELFALELMEKAVPFYLPKDGAIEQPDIPQIDSTAFRPPYPVTLLIFDSSEGMELDSKHVLGTASKRAALVLDVTDIDVRNIINKHTPHTQLGHYVDHLSDTDGAIIWPIDSLDDNASGAMLSSCDYQPCWVSGFVPYSKPHLGRAREEDVEDDGYEQKVFDNYVESTGRAPVIINAIPLPMSQSALETAESMTSEDRNKSFTIDTGLEVTAYLALCAMLHCSNVDPVKVDAPAKLNKARLKRGQEMLPDYYVIGIKTSGTPVKDTDATKNPDRKSPKPHSRRGHTRRYQDGRVIWIPSSFIGAREVKAGLGEYHVML